MPGSAPSSPHLQLPASREDGFPRMVPAWGDAQRAAHRGDRIGDLIRLHESEPFDGIDLVSLANQAAAFDRTSCSNRSCLFPRRRSANSSCSKVVRPSFLFPSSRSACLTQLWMARAEGANSRESSSGFLPARINSTIRQRNSKGSGRHDFGMTDTSSSKDYSVHESVPTLS